MALSELYKKLTNTDPIYLWNEFDEVFVKIIPGKGFWIKPPGKDEYEVEPGSGIVAIAMAGEKLVTKNQYDNGRL